MASYENIPKEELEILTAGEHFSYDQVYKMTFRNFIDHRVDKDMLDYETQEQSKDEKDDSDSENTWKDILRVPESKIERVDIDLPYVRNLLHRLRSYASKGAATQTMEKMRVAVLSQFLEIMKVQDGVLKTNATELEKTLGVYSETLLMLYAETIQILIRLEIHLDEAEKKAEQTNSEE
jgi:hypothetical protein